MSGNFLRTLVNIQHTSYEETFFQEHYNVHYLVFNLFFKCYKLFHNVQRTLKSNLPIFFLKHLKNIQI